MASAAKEHLIKSKRRHCERSEAIHVFGLSNIHACAVPRRYAPRNAAYPSIPDERHFSASPPQWRAFRFALIDSA
jgi:hypothetical protein